MTVISKSLINTVFDVDELAGSVHTRVTLNAARLNKSISYCISEAESDKVAISRNKSHPCVLEKCRTLMNYHLIIHTSSAQPFHDLEMY